MTTKTFIIVSLIVAALVVAAVYIHRPPSEPATRIFPHGRQ
jgi:preprotein translocase subunit SecG